MGVCGYSCEKNPTFNAVRQKLYSPCDRAKKVNRLNHISLYVLTARRFYAGFLPAVWEIPVTLSALGVNKRQKRLKYAAWWGAIPLFPFQRQVQQTICGKKLPCYGINRHLVVIFYPSSNEKRFGNSRGAFCIAKQIISRNKPNFANKPNNGLFGTNGTMISAEQAEQSSPCGTSILQYFHLLLLFFNRKYIQLWLVYIILYILAAAQLRLLSSGVFLCFAPLHFSHSHQRRRSVFFS